MTVSKGQEELCVGSPSSFGEYFRNRNHFKSQTSVGSDDNSFVNDVDESEGYQSSRSPSPPYSPSASKLSRDASIIPITSTLNNARKPRVRLESSCLDSAFTAVRI